MKQKRMVLIWGLLAGLTVCGQDKPVFEALRYEDDYLVFKNNKRDGYTKFKYHPMDSSGESYLGIGGELRLQYMRYKNEGWGDNPADPGGYLLNRSLLHVDFHAGSKVRAFAQFQSSLAASRIDPGPVERNQLELHQAFVELALFAGKSVQVRVRAGRQEMSYGSQRLVSVRELPNNRQSFDAVKFMFSWRGYTMDLFGSEYVVAEKGMFNDRFLDGPVFRGIYMTRRGLFLNGHADLYYFGLSKPDAVFDDGRGKEKRQSVGSRIWNTGKGFRYDAELVYQWGKLGEKSIRAWTISINAGYQLADIKYQPELGLKAELISGDGQYGDQRLGTFNPLFPKGAYFGLAALIGPANLKDLHPSLNMQLFPGMKLNIDLDYLWRYRSNDGVYTPGMGLIYSGKNITSKFIGTQYAADLGLTANDYLFLRLEGTWFVAGRFLKEAGAGRDLLFGCLTAQLKF